MKENFVEQVDYVLHDRAAKRAGEVYDKKIKGRKMRDFIDDDLYTEEEINKREEEVVQMERYFKQQEDNLSQEDKSYHEISKKLASCLEGIILNQKTWFGPTSNIYPTTEYDDYKNGIDLVAERMKDGVVNHHGFALDVTYAGRDKIRDKIDRIIKRLKEGELGKIIFFKSDDGKFKGQLGQIPLVVVGVDGNTMKGLVNAFAEGEDMKIESHPAQFQIIEQVLMQCDLYISIANQIEDKGVSVRVVKAYETLKNDFNSILKLKKMINPDIVRNFRDTFHSNISEVITNFKNR
jgi:hypothetical protein